jgi:hypothetical protein
MEEMRLTGKGFLLTALLLPHEEGDKVLFMRELATKKLAENGLRPKHLEQFSGQSSSKIPYVHHWIAIADFVENVIADDVILAASFVDWIYRKGFFSDRDSILIFEKMKYDHALCH